MLADRAKFCSLIITLVVFKKTTNYSSSFTLTNVTGTVSTRQTWYFPSASCPGGGGGPYNCGSTDGAGDITLVTNGGPPDQNITWTLMNVVTSAPNMYFTTYDISCQ